MGISSDKIDVSDLFFLTERNDLGVQILEINGQQSIAQKRLLIMARCKVILKEVQNQSFAP